MPSLSFSALMSSSGNRPKNRRCGPGNHAPSQSNPRGRSTRLSEQFPTSMSATRTQDDREYTLSLQTVTNVDCEAVAEVNFRMPVARAQSLVVRPIGIHEERPHFHSALL